MNETTVEATNKSDIEKMTEATFEGKILNQLIHQIKKKYTTNRF